jgi:hypothetical protein
VFRKIVYRKALSAVYAFVFAVALTAAGCSSSSSPVGPDPAEAPAEAPSAPVPAPQPAPAPVVYPSNGPSVVRYVAKKYPEKLRGGISRAERRRNMEFLRDRIIDVGRCGGMNMAWNRKRNGQRSVDAIDWRHGARDINDVVDIASDYDNASRPLELHWVITAGPAGWDPAPPPSCQ